VISQAYLVAWFRAFLFTPAAEAPVYVVVTRRVVPAWRAALAGMACSCLTHPLLWFVWPRVVPASYAAYVVSGELLVCVIESAAFFALAGGLGRRSADETALRLPLSLAVAASFLANATSYGLGLVLRVVGWR
jgi:hypothetical protein